jgi:hypothetical protein
MGEEWREKKHTEVIPGNRVPARQPANKPTSPRSLTPRTRPKGTPKTRDDFADPSPRATVGSRPQSGPIGPEKIKAAYTWKDRGCAGRV